jgi:hypothetical protein
MGLDDGTADAKSHADAMRFSGKEGIEYPVYLVRGNPHTCVTH